MPRILIVDPDTREREEVAAAISASGLEPLLASSRIVGLQLFERPGADVVISAQDLRDPKGKTGLMLLREIRKHPLSIRNSARTPFILLSVSSSPNLREAVRIGRGDFLYKGDPHWTGILGGLVARLLLEGE